MSNVYIVGVATSPFARHPKRDHHDLAGQVVRAALADAGGGGPESIWFANCGLHAWGQPNIRGHVCLTDLFLDEVLAPHTPIINVEGGCATGAMALLGAINDVRAGASNLALAVGVEKTFIAHAPEKIGPLFAGGLDQLKPDRWTEMARAAATEHGLEYAPHPARIPLLDLCALKAEWHMKTFGTTAEDIAASAAKNHDHGALNPNAQYRKAMTVDEVLADKPVVGPFTRAMCAPISDGAAAVLVCNDAGLQSLSAETRERAIVVLGSALTSGRLRKLEERSLTAVAAARAYQRAGIEPDTIDLAEVHDATSFDEIYLCEALGFAETGAGGPYVASGATRLGGARPINTSGGLVSKGHPLGATGLAMIHELTLQLRGEAGDRQVRDGHTALAQNGGGMVGLEEAASAVVILQRPS